MPSSLLYYGLGYLFYDRPVAEFWLFNNFYVGQKRRLLTTSLCANLTVIFQWTVRISHFTPTLMGNQRENGWCMKLESSVISVSCCVFFLNVVWFVCMVRKRILLNQWGEFFLSSICWTRTLRRERLTFDNNKIKMLETLNLLKNPRASWTLIIWFFCVQTMTWMCSKWPWSIPWWEIGSTMGVSDPSQCQLKKLRNLG